MFIHNDDHGAVASQGVQSDGLGPRASEVHLAVAALGGNLDRGGMLCSVVADSLLHIGDGHVLTSAVEFSQRSEGSSESLAVETVVAVAGTAVTLGSKGLADGTQVILQVHLHHLEDGLTELSLGRVVHAGRHVGSTTGVGNATTNIIGDTINRNRGTGTCFTENLSQ